MSEGRPGRRGRLAVVGILAAGLLYAYAAGELNLGSRAGAQPGWTDYQNAERGFWVEYPASWKRTDSPMFPSILEPRSILTVSTFAIPPGGDRGECGFIPSRVGARVGRDGAAVLIFEHFASPGGFGSKFLRRTPIRPANFHLDEAHGLSSPYFASPRGRLTPGAESNVWEFPFQDEGRIFVATVLLGSQASAERGRDAVDVLDSLRFRPRAPGGAS